MKNKTMEALIEMGLPANLKGFKYIMEALCLYEEDEELIHNKAITLYQRIAEKNKDSVGMVERAIRYAFGFLLKKGDPAIVNKYLTYQNTNNGNLLAVFYYRLKTIDKK